VRTGPSVRRTLGRERRSGPYGPKFSGPGGPEKTGFLVHARLGVRESGAPGSGPLVTKHTTMLTESNMTLKARRARSEEPVGLTEEVRGFLGG